MSGKGSRERPASVDAATYAANYARTFGSGRDELPTVHQLDHAIVVASEGVPSKI